MNEVADHGLPPRGERRADIQGLRGLAVLLVVAFHAGLPLPGGFVGVDVFFVISGFVIAGMLLRELEATGGLNFATFYTRRIRRLLPALATVIAVVAIVSALVLSPLSNSQQHTAATGVAASISAANVQLSGASTGYFDRSVNALLHTWSLSVEEQFYLFFPVFLLCAWHLSRRAARRLPVKVTLGALLTIFAFGSFALSVWLTPNNPKFAFYASPTRAWEFAAGALLALMVPLLGRIPRGVATALGVIGATLIGVAARTYSAATPFPGWAALVPVIGAGLILAAGVATTKGVTSLLRTRPAVWLGDVSYGWYLWHWPMIVFAGVLWPATTWVLPVAGVLSLLPTWCSYRLIEQPIRFNPAITGRRLVRLVAACLLIPMGCSFALSFTAGAALTSASVKQIQGGLAPHADDSHGCNGTDLDVLTKPSCTWRTPGSNGAVVLVGDSNAGQFTEPVAAAANRLGLDMTVATAANCPFVDLWVTAPPGSFTQPGCHRFVEGLVRRLVQLHPRLVVIASASASYIGGPWQLRMQESDRLLSDPQQKALLWEQALARVLRPLDDAGIATLVVHTIPYVGADVGLCPAFRLYTNPKACGATDSRALVDAGHRPAAASVDKAVGQYARARSVDFTADLCGPLTCTTYRGRQWLYLDTNHLSVGGALTLTDHFVELFRLQT